MPAGNEVDVSLGSFAAPLRVRLCARARPDVLKFGQLRFILSVDWLFGCSSQRLCR